ncbi:MAG: peptidoglycan-binding protein [Candidatus Aminicenantes bacterium]|nr:peptidoglycan-binding protein [Candidatus Aminicenantes bacterium]
MRAEGKSLRRKTLVLIVVIVAISSCGRAPAVPPAEMTRTVLQTRVGAAGSDGPVYCRRDLLCGSTVLPDFYRSRDFRPAWVDDGLSLASARALPAALRVVEGDGLDPENYHLAAIESLLAEIDAARAKGLRRVRPEALADLDMLATDGFLLCASHLLHGQVNPETVESEWSIKGRVADLAAALDRGLAAHDVAGALDALRPRNPVYLGLRNVYVAYGALALRGGWPAVPPGPKLAKGDRDARVRAIRTTLLAQGDLSAAPAAPDPDLFDEALERGVEAFQARHGLEPDGVVGAGTVSALNVPPAERLMQIRANLERWRWVTQDLGERYILVNVAGFRAGVYEAGREVLPMRAIVGKAYRQTPDFSGRLSTITLNPAWNVPPKLAREDILPKVRKDPGYLRKKGFRIFEDWTAAAREIDPSAVDWERIDGERLSFKFRQDPGPQNSLGRIMFLFPNKFDVYLHDTPERWLFSRAVRDFSSGCIRVERPLDLASYILRDDPVWTKEKIAEALASGETKAIPLRERLNVHLLYWTAWLGDDGRAQFRQDIYLRDAALVRALGERAAARPRP